MRLNRSATQLLARKTWMRVTLYELLHCTERSRQLPAPCARANSAIALNPIPRRGVSSGEMVAPQAFC